MPKNGREAVSVADTVGIYLEEVSAHLLLTAEDEVGSPDRWSPADGQRTSWTPAKS